MTWKEEIDRHPGWLVQRPGHSVKMCLGLQGVQYKKDGRSLTLSAVLVDKTRELGRRWLIMRTYGLVISVPRLPQWDDGTQLTTEEAYTVKEQISSALDEIGMPHFFEGDDQQAVG